jgi:hypothetical protein
LPKSRSKELSGEDLVALKKLHALSSDDIDEDFRRAAKLSQMVRKPPSRRVAQPPKPQEQKPIQNHKNNKPTQHQNPTTHNKRRNRPLNSGVPGRA